MGEQIYKLLARMIVATMTGQRETVQELYEQYLRERHLYVSVREILESKRRMAG